MASASLPGPGDVLSPTRAKRPTQHAVRAAAWLTELLKSASPFPAQPWGWNSPQKQPHSKPFLWEAFWRRLGLRRKQGKNVLQCLGGVTRGSCAPAGQSGAPAGSSASCRGLVLPGAHTLLLINSLFNTKYIFLTSQHFLTLLPLGLEQEFSVAERGCMCVCSVNT